MMSHALDGSMTNIIDLTEDPVSTQTNDQKSIIDESIANRLTESRKGKTLQMGLQLFETKIIPIEPFSHIKTPQKDATAWSGNAQNAQTVPEQEVQGPSTYLKSTVWEQYSSSDCEKQPVLSKNDTLKHPRKRRRINEKNTFQGSKKQEIFKHDAHHELPAYTEHSDMSTSSSDDVNLHRSGKKRRILSSRKRFTREDDKLLRDLKERSNLTWEQIRRYFPGRTWYALQSRYSKVLKLLSLGSEPESKLASEIHIKSANPKEQSHEIQQIAKPRGRRRKGFKDSIEDCDEDEKKTPSLFITFPLELESIMLDRNKIAYALLVDKIVSEQGDCILPRPYLSLKERSHLQSGFSYGQWNKHNIRLWEGQTLHVSFLDEEILEIIHSLEEWSTVKLPSVIKSLSFSIVLRKLIRNASGEEIWRIARMAAKRELLSARTADSIEVFLQDLSQETVPKTKAFLSIGHGKGDTAMNRNLCPSTNHLLRARELGFTRRFLTDGRYGPPVALSNSVYGSYGPSKSFTGTSGDVGTVSWSRDGNLFAAGSVCLVDEDNMQYNRPNNLLLGNYDQGWLRELPDHATERKQPSKGVNATHEMHVSQDRSLYMTVPAVRFSKDGSHMFSAGYDNIVRAWNICIDTNNISCVSKIQHKAAVDVIAIANDDITDEDILATGCQNNANEAIQVVRFSNSQTLEKKLSLSSKKAIERPEASIYPSSLQWAGNYLLAGFAANDADGGRDVLGEVCLWDCKVGKQLSVIPCAGNVFDCTWNPNRGVSPLFAAASVAGINVNRGTRSVVRMYDYRAMKYTGTMELECTALDINDLLYSRYDDHYICAGCTDGNIYIWDVRNPDNLLHKLMHGTPLMPLDSSLPREVTDTGVRFCSWGDNHTRLYTGSSDGLLKSWDIYKSAEDVFVQDIVQLNSGIMSGEFSKDFSRILLGEVNGSINALQVGCRDIGVTGTERLHLIQSEEPFSQVNFNIAASAERESGIAEANKLLHDKVMDLQPMGAYTVRQAVQGSNYVDGGGPVDLAEDSEDYRGAAMELQMSFKQQENTAKCCIPSCGNSEKIITSEEVGDSGRWEDRIAQSLRDLKLNAKSESIGLKYRCKTCGRPARDEKRICELCGFSCFRCGQKAAVSPCKDDELFVECKKCKCRWRVEVLGYTFLRKVDKAQNSNQSFESESMAKPEVGGVEQPESIFDSEHDVSECIREYYHSLWMDRPPSPL